MGTRLEGVQIPLELDATKALQQLDAIERRVQALAKKSLSIKATASGTEREAAAQRATGTTSASGGPATQTLASRAIKAITAASPSSSPVAGVLSKARAVGGGRVALGAGIASKLAPAGSTLAAGVAGAAVVYGVTRGVAKGGSAVAAIAEGAFPDLAQNPAFKALAEQLNGLRNAINFIEAKVGSFITGIGKTHDMSTAMARIHGKIPNLPGLFDVFRESDRFEAELEKKFKDLQSDEVMRAYGLSGKALMKGLHR